MSPFSALFRLITGVEPAVTVSAGEKVTLVAVVGTNWVPVTWKLPGKGEVVQNYDPTLATNQLTPLGQTIDGAQVVSGSSDITFEWVGGGNFAVNATLAGANGTSTTVYAALSVQAPNVTVNATVKQPLLAGDKLSARRRS